MGTNTVNTFENEDAANWLPDFLSGSDLGLVKLALETADVDADEYLEAPEGAVAVAAIEIVAACMGRPGPSVLANDDLSAWLNEFKPRPGPRLVELALDVLHRVTGANSELADLMGESGDQGDEWCEEMRELAGRLGG